MRMGNYLQIGDLCHGLVGTGTLLCDWQRPSDAATVMTENGGGLCVFLQELGRVAGLGWFISR